MRTLTTSFLHTIKDQVRGVRYSIRAEAEVPGSALPKIFHEANLRPLVAIGSVVGTPALRMADGILTQVETVTTGVFNTLTGGFAPPAFPVPLPNYVAAVEGSTAASFTDVLYEYLKQALQGYGARNLLISEQALNAAWMDFTAREGDRLYATLAGSESARDRLSLIRLCAGMTVALVAARPIKRVEFDDKTVGRPRHLLLSPNLYCGLVAGLATAIVTTRPATADDREAVLESADAAVDARFSRFKEALDSKEAASALAGEFQAVLPFLP